MLKLQDYPSSENFVAFSLQVFSEVISCLFRVTSFIAYYEGHMSHETFNFKIYLIWMCKTAQLLVPEFQEKYLEIQSYTALKVLKIPFLFLFLLHDFFISFLLLSLFIYFNTYRAKLIYCFLLFYKHFFECLLKFQVNPCFKEKSLAIHDKADVSQCKISLST